MVDAEAALKKRLDELVQSKQPIHLFFIEPKPAG
jgi:hypothetical protein